MLGELESGGMDGWVFHRILFQSSLVGNANGNGMGEITSSDTIAVSE